MKTEINYDGRVFRAITNSANGEVSGETLFHYRQEGNVVSAEYRGGEIIFGNLVAKVFDDFSLEMSYQHLNMSGELMTGRCLSTPEVLPDGRLRLHERWRWTSGDHTGGESVVEEIAS